MLFFLLTTLLFFSYKYYVPLG